MIRMVHFLLLLIAGFGWSMPAQAHEVRPAYLEIIEHRGGRVDIMWKQPTLGSIAVPLRPRLSGGALDRAPDRVRLAAHFRIADWEGLDLRGAGLHGRTVTIEGLERTITDTLVVVNLASGETLHRILTPSTPAFVIDTGGGMAVPGYLLLGISHILTGIDHLLFVFGLILLSSSWRSVVATITAFTIAHSITLALTALKLIAVNVQFIEAMVALSILFLAGELVRKARKEQDLTLRYPWLIAFGFGLLHGAAFAGALHDIGLPRDNVPAALFLFNVGVEIGQLLFVSGTMAIFAVLRHVRPSPRLSEFALWAAIYSIGIFSAFWFLQRLQAAI